MKYYPGSIIGMLGGGQLGRMSLLAGRKMGYRFAVLESKKNSPAGQIADHEIISAYDDETGLEQLGKLANVATLEFENIPTRSIEFLEDYIPVYPGKKALHLSQNREREKTFLSENGFPCVPFAIVESESDLEAAVNYMGLPVVLKTADFGYDGKGQIKITDGDDLTQVWTDFEAPKGVVEKWVQYEGEYSILIARNPSGEEAVYPLAKNVHRNHILHTTVLPCGLDERFEDAAKEMARGIADALEFVGILAIELFLVDGELLVNEVAPRPHNSGHYSFDGSLTSQFEQHIRAVCDMPLGGTELLKPVCMLNLLGDIWHSHDPDWTSVLRDPAVKLHLYDKGEPRLARKMGHLNVFGASAEEALEKALKIDQFLYSKS